MVVPDSLLIVFGLGVARLSVLLLAVAAGEYLLQAQIVYPAYPLTCWYIVLFYF